jgi:hypothetical protein
MKIIPETRHLYLIRCIRFYYSGKNFISDMMKTPDTHVERAETTLIINGGTITINAIIYVK